MNRTKITIVVTLCVSALLLVFARPKIGAPNQAALTAKAVPRAVQTQVEPEGESDLYNLTREQREALRRAQETHAAELAKRAPAALTPTVGGAWMSLGPAPAINGQLAVPPDNRFCGAIQSLAPHRSNADILYVASVGGGIWRTANATAANPTWTPLTDDQPSLSMGAIEFDPTDLTNQTLVASSSTTSSYGGIGGKRIGVLRTTNGGNTWTRLGANDFANEGLISVTARGAVLMTGSDNAQGEGNGSGLFRSTDTGATWTLLSNGTTLPVGGVSDIVGDPLVPTRFYAASRYSGIYRSDDTGATWVNISGTITGIMSANNIKIEMALHHNGANEALYVGVIRNDGPPANAALKLVWRSANPSGVSPSFTAMDFAVGHNGGQGTVHFSIAAHPTNANLVYIAGDRDLNSGGANVQLGDASLAAGTQWKSICRENANNGTGSGDTAPHSDSREMFFDANGSLIESDDGGIYRRSNPTLTTGIWSSVVGNLAVVEAHDSAYDAVAHVGMAGTQDNGCSIQSASNSMVWNWISDGDGGDVAIDDISTPGFSYRFGSAQVNGGFYRRKFDASNVLVSSENPPLTVLSGGPAFDPAFNTPYAINKINGARMIIGGNNAAYESLDQADSITALSPNSGITWFFGKPIAYGGRFNGVPNPDVLYYGSGNTVKLRTTAGGAVTDTAFPGDEPHDIVLDNNDWHNVFVASYFQVYRSPNAGGTWTNITGNLPDVGILHTLEFFRLNGTDCVAVGADGGVFVSFVNDLGNWQRLGTGLPGVVVYDMQYNAPDNVLIVGTLGRGVWKINLPGALQITTAVSRKTHGGAGPFNVVLPLVGTPGIECRDTGGNHTLVFTFTNDVVSGSASVTSGTGSVMGSPTFSSNTMSVNLTGVTNAQQITVKLSGVTDAAAQVLSDTTVNMIALAGDTTGNKQVNSSDVSQTKLQSGAPVNGVVGAANFRNDVSVDGSINSTDVSMVKLKTGTAVP